MSLFRALLVVFSLMMPPVQALSIAPTSLELDLRSGAAEAELTLTADAGASLDIELDLLARGDPTVPAVEVELLPPLLSIPAGESRRVRLRAQARPQSSGSASFHLEIQPVGLDAEFAQAADGRREVRFRTRFLVPVHLDLGGQPAFACRLIDGPGGRQVELRNPGTRYLRFGQAVLSLRDAAGSTVASYTGLMLARPLGSDALLPGETLSLPLDDRDPAATVAVCTVAPERPAAVR